MTAWFAAPWGLAALLALPALYWLHRHVLAGRRRDVSNLALWADREHVKREGRQRRRISDQLVLALEAAAALALVLVIAGFEPQTVRATRPRVALVIDASASMSGGSPGRRPIDAVRQQLAALAREQPELRVSLVLAGPEPALLGDVDLSVTRADALLARFEPHAASARVGPALDLARSLDLQDDNLLLFSDDPALSHPRLMRVGSAEPNLAIVRASWQESEAPFLVLQRFGPGPAEITAHVRIDGGAETLQTVRLNADAEAPLSLRVTPEVQRVDVHLPGDALTLDDHATLFRPAAREIHVDTSAARPPLRAAFARAASAIPRLRSAHPGAGELRVVETAAPPGAEPVLLFLSEPGAKARLAGALQSDPFSPLMAAFDVRGLVWFAWPRQAPSHAQVLLRAEDQPLIWREAAQIILNVDVERSNLLSHAAFPLFLDALVSELDRARGGLPRRSFALGERLSFARAAGVPGDMHVIRPSGERSTFRPGEPIDLGVLAEPGIYVLQTDAQNEPFAVQLQSPGESNLHARLKSSAAPSLSLRDAPSAEARPFWSSLLLLVALACFCLAFTRLERRAESS